MRGSREAAHSPVTTALTPNPSPRRGEGRPGALLASAYPDRIAMARDRRGEFLMANGRAAALEPHDPLAGEPFLAIGEIAGRAASARNPPGRRADPRRRREDRQRLDRDGGRTQLRPRLRVLASAARRRLSALTLAEQTLPIPQDDTVALALARGVLSLGVARLPWTKALKQRRDRVMFLAQAEGEARPELSDEALAANPAWLAPFLIGKTRLDATSAPTIFAGARRDAALGPQAAP